MGGAERAGGTHLDPSRLSPFTIAIISHRVKQFMREGYTVRYTSHQPFVHTLTATTNEATAASAHKMQELGCIRPRKASTFTTHTVDTIGTQGKGVYTPYGNCVAQ